MRAILRTVLGLGFGWVGVRLLGLLGRFHGTPPVARRATRRSFVRNATLGAVGVVLAEIGAGFLWFFWPTKTGAFGSVLTVPSEEVPGGMGEPYRSVAGKFFLAHTQEGLLAMYWKCPHLGCTVPWVGPPDSPNAYQCPCHGSMYNYVGERTGGPAPRPLDWMQVTVDDAGNVKVDTGAISTRGAYDPKEQVVPYPA